MAARAMQPSGKQASGNWMRLAAWSAAGSALLVPLVAMQFTKEVNWGVGDFLIAAALLFAIGGAIELALRVVPGRGWRVAALLALVAAFLLVWAELAVGLFD